MKYDALLRVSIITVIVTGFVGGPIYTIGPADFRLIDLSILFLTALLVVSLRKEPIISIAVTSSISMIISGYLLLVLLLPIIGLVLYQYPLAYVLGDVRWLHALLLGAAMFVVYSSRSRHSLFVDIRAAVIITVMIYSIFTAAQIGDMVGFVDISHLMTAWYGDQPVDREVGYGAGRFAGPATQLAYTGRVASLSVLVLTYSYILTKSRLDLFFTVASISVLVSSGHRTSMVSTGVGLLILAFTSDRYRAAFRRRHTILKVVTASAIPLTIAYILDLGGVRTSPRYYEIVQLLTGQRGWGEITGRDTERWLAPVEYVQAEYFLGTLANPSWVLAEFPIFDSYYVISYLQGGILLLGSYVLLLTFLFAYGFKFRETPEGMISIFIIVVIGIASLTQNLQGLFQKLVIIISLTSILISMEEDSTSTENRLEAD